MVVFVEAEDDSRGPLSKCACAEVDHGKAKRGPDKRADRPDAPKIMQVRPHASELHNIACCVLAHTVVVLLLRDPVSCPTHLPQQIGSLSTSVVFCDAPYRLFYDKILDNGKDKPNGWGKAKGPAPRAKGRCQ